MIIGCIIIVAIMIIMIIGCIALQCRDRVVAVPFRRHLWGKHLRNGTSSTFTFRWWILKTSLWPSGRSGFKTLPPKQIYQWLWIGWTCLFPKGNGGVGVVAKELASCDHHHDPCVVFAVWETLPPTALVQLSHFSIGNTIIASFMMLLDILCLNFRI